MKLAADGLRKLSEFGDTYDLNVIVENHGGLSSHGRWLASVMEKMPSPPLLVISSDMNHFATDAENRRLDRIALDALKTLDPAKLFHTVREHQISMCGMLPAVAVLETLRKLDRLRRYEEVAYATSADVSGDKRRVVGYAGALIGS